MHFCPLTSDIEQDNSEKMKDTLGKLCNKIGNPRNYGPTPEEKAEMAIQEQEEMVLVYILSHDNELKFIY